LQGSFNGIVPGLQYRIFIFDFLPLVDRFTVGASAIIIAHNHPSGQLTPSAPDKKITEVIKNAGKILDIDLFDHMILGEDSFYSFAENGML